MKILVIGGSGNFGSSLVDFFRKKGHEVSGVDKGEKVPLSIGEFDACFLAIPVEPAIEFVAGNEHPMLIEVCSVKTPMKKYHHRVVSIHPMFGPSSIWNPEFQNIIFINDISPPESIKTIEGLFGGFTIFSMTAEEHDRLMVKLQVRPYILSLLAQRTSSDTSVGVSCTSHRKLLDLMSISQLESRAALMDTIGLNPHSLDAIKDLRDELGRILTEFSSMQDG